MSRRKATWLRNDKAFQADASTRHQLRGRLQEESWGGPACKQLVTREAVHT